MKCTDCEGQGAMHLWTSTGRRAVTCSLCAGSGEIDLHRAACAAYGKRLQRDRVSRRLSGREEAQRLGVTPLELNRLEFGKPGCELVAEKLRLPDYPSPELARHRLVQEVEAEAALGPGTREDGAAVVREQLREWWEGE